VNAVTAIVSDPDAFTHRRTNDPDFTTVNKAVLSANAETKRTTNVEAEQSTNCSTKYNANHPAHRATFRTAL
jgi:hypothetical protein